MMSGLSGRERIVRRMTWRARPVPALYSLALALVVLAPLFGSGYLLLRDAVSTPRSYLTDSSFGLGDAAPRAVPQDAFVAVVSAVVDGGVLVKLLLLAALWAAGWGAAAMVSALVPRLGLGPQLVASTVAIWNPYVAERLLQGHWSLLVGYGALPWTVRAAAATRAGGGLRSWSALAVCLATAGLTPTGAVLATVAAAAVVRVRHIAGVAVVAAAVCAPWLLATWLSGSGSSSDPAGVAAFAARAEPGLGTLGSLAGLGGIWNSAAVPDSRTTLFALLGTALLLGVVGLGVPALYRLRADRVVAALVVLAAAAVVFGALAATPPGVDVLEWAVVHVPGTGLLRDTQKWVALALPAFALAAALGCAALTPRFVATPVVLTMLVLVALPDLFWGVGGKIRPVQYPAGWSQVAAEIDGTSGDVAVLPAGMFRKFGYSGSAPVLDPAPRMLPADVLQTGELVVAGGAVRGEGSRAETVERLLLAGAPANDLAALGVRWVLVERTTPGPLGASQQTLDQLTRRYTDAELALYEVPGVVVRESNSRAAAGAAHLVWFAVLAGGVLGVAVGRRPADEPGHSLAPRGRGENVEDT